MARGGRGKRKASSIPEQPACPSPPSSDLFQVTKKSSTRQTTHKRKLESQVQELPQPEPEDRVNELRLFDVDASFGPYIGILRSERWDRAQRLGFNPPKRIRELLDNATDLPDRDIDTYSQMIKAQLLLV